MINPYPQFQWITLWKKCVQAILIYIIIANVTKLLKINHSIIIHINQIVKLFHIASRGIITIISSKSGSYVSDCV